MKKITKQIRNTLTIAIFILAISATSALAATFTVTNTNDSGAGSLRDALNQANTNAQADTINFDPAFFNVARTITLTSGEIAISPDGTNPGRLLTINGPGANLLTISGNNASRIFLLGPQFNANVTMSGMTLRDGNGISSVASSGNGGAIHLQVAASLTLSSMVIRNNVATSASGGAIYSNTSRNIVINDSLITENSARDNGGIFALEGTSVLMRNTIVSNNRATFTNNGAIGFVGGNIDIRNCQITGNSAMEGVGGLSVFRSVLNISDTVISNNTAERNIIGGMTIRAGDATLRRVTISNNTSIVAAGGINIDGPVTIIDSTISNNAVGIAQSNADSYGGGIYVSVSSTTKIINTTISGNSAGYAGGGIYNATTELELINSTVVNNSTTSNSTFERRGGGGIFDGEIARVNQFGNRVKLQNSIIAGNTSGSGLGPDLYSGFVSAGYNIIGNTANTNSSTANTGDMFNVNPQVAALANNGGPTQTHALLAGSPAINAGSNALAVDQNGVALRFDQRGPCYNRRVGGTTDIGAYEFGAVMLSGKNATFDFDGDCKSDISVFRPSNGAWYLNQSQNGFTGVTFGLSTDLLTPADFDGDGITDIAVFRPSNGAWYYLRSSDGAFVGLTFGQNGDIPRPADFDGDGKADISVFRPSNGAWYRLNSSNGSFSGTIFGQKGDKPLIADYDGDGKADIAVFRPSARAFYWLESSTGQFKAIGFGFSTDIPTQGDFDGDGKTDIAVFRPSNGAWYRYNSTNGAFFGVGFGQNGDLPVTGDYDGDGKSDIAVFRPSAGAWYYLNSSNGGFVGLGFGFGTDKPIPAAFQ